MNINLDTLKAKALEFVAFANANRTMTAVTFVIGFVVGAIVF